MNAVAVCLALSLAAAPGGAGLRGTRVHVVVSGEAAFLGMELRDALRRAGCTVLGEPVGAEVIVQGELRPGPAITLKAADPTSQESLAEVAELSADPAAGTAATRELAKQAVQKLVQQLSDAIARRQTEGRMITLTVRGLDFGGVKALTRQLLGANGIRSIGSNSVTQAGATMVVQTLVQALRGARVEGKRLTVSKLNPAAVECTVTRR